MARMKIRAFDSLASSLVKLLRPLFVSMVLAGCTAAEGPAYQAAPVTQAKSALYLYLPYTAIPAVTALNFVPPSFIIDCGNFSFQLKNGAYRRFVIDPGPVKCATSDSTVNFTAEAGRNYYIRESLHSALFRPVVNIEYVTPEDAKAEIEQCKEQLPP
jgi:hypothetical protein